MNEMKQSGKTKKANDKPFWRNCLAQSHLFSQNIFLCKYIQRNINTESLETDFFPWTKIQYIVSMSTIRV